MRHESVGRYGIAAPVFGDDAGDTADSGVGVVADHQTTAEYGGFCIVRGARTTMRATCPDGGYAAWCESGHNRERVDMGPIPLEVLSLCCHSGDPAWRHESSPSRVAHMGGYRPHKFSRPGERRARNYTPQAQCARRSSKYFKTGLALRVNQLFRFRWLNWLIGPCILCLDDAQ